MSLFTRDTESGGKDCYDGIMLFAAAFVKLLSLSSNSWSRSYCFLAYFSSKVGVISVSFLVSLVGESPDILVCVCMTLIFPMPPRSVLPRYIMFFRVCGVSYFGAVLWSSSQIIFLKRGFSQNRGIYSMRWSNVSMPSSFISLSILCSNTITRV